MIKGLDRPMFRNTNAPQFTGLEAYQGTMGGGNMPMNGIMGFADGGNPEEEMKKVSENYRQMKTPYNTMGVGEGRPDFVNEGSVLDYVLKGGSGGLRGDISEAASLGLSAIPDTAIRGIEALGFNVTDKEAPTYEALLGAGDYLMVFENRLPSETIGGGDITWAMDGETIPASQAEEINTDILSAAKGSIEQNPETAQAANDIAEQTDKADNPYTLALNAAGSKGTGDPDTDAKAVDTMVADIASGAGMDVTPEEVDVKNTPHNAIALMLAGFKMMQTKGTVGEAIGAGGEAGVSYLANVAEKEAERAKDLREAAIKAEGTANDTTDIRNAQYMKTTLGKFFPDATDAAFFDLARQSTQADPELMVSKMSEEMIGIDPGVARNYSYMVVNTDIARRLGVDDPVVGVDRSGNGYTFGDINALTSVEGSKFDNAAEAASALGIRYIPLSDIYNTTMSLQQNAAE